MSDIKITEIEQIKKEIIELHFGPCDLNPEGMSVEKFNFYAYARQRFSSLITTIESLQVEKKQYETTVTHQQEAFKDQGKEILQYRRELESQKEEIEKWRRVYGQERQFSDKFQHERDEAIKKSVFWEDHCGNSELRIESLKAITELTEECLKEISDGGSTGEDARDMRISADFTLAKIKELQNGTT